MAHKVAATDKLHASSSIESRARRATFNMSDGGHKDSLDQKIYEAVAEQAGTAGLEYGDGPEY